MIPIIKLICNTKHYCSDFETQMTYTLYCPWMHQMQCTRAAYMTESSYNIFHIHNVSFLIKQAWVVLVEEQRKYYLFAILCQIIKAWVGKTQDCRWVCNGFILGFRTVFRHALYLNNVWRIRSRHHAKLCFDTCSTQQQKVWVARISLRESLLGFSVGIGRCVERAWGMTWHREYAMEITVFCYSISM